jgi:hypothetical protein
MSRSWTEATPEGVEALIASCSGRGGRESEAAVSFMPAELDDGYFTITGTHGAYIAQCVRRCPSAVLAFQIDHERGHADRPRAWSVRFDAAAARSLSSVLVVDDRYQARKAKQVTS